MEDQLRELAEVPAVRAGAFIVGSIIAAYVIEWIIRMTLGALTRRTKSKLDDMLVDALKRPIFISVVLIGLALATDELPITTLAILRVDSVLQTFAVLVWSGAAFRIGEAVLEALVRRGKSTSIVQARTFPVFDMLLKVVVVGTAVYFGFLAWRIDLTAWLASAGIIGIAIGFAAKDTLANLFSGLFIVADAPYKVGDTIVLDGGLRGRVTKIGIRSTRVLTPDDIEVTVPNAVIAGSKIVNESGGPEPKQRLRIPVDCAYGVALDQVRETLLTCPAGVDHVSTAPPPQVLFVEMGASGLRFELCVWIDDPGKRASVIDALNSKIYNALNAAKIEIPYAKRDIYIKEMPK